VEYHYITVQLYDFTLIIHDFALAGSTTCIVSCYDSSFMLVLLPRSNVELCVSCDDL
jgi:hypothetical protein